MWIYVCIVFFLQKAKENHLYNITFLYRQLTVLSTYTPNTYTYVHIYVHYASKHASLTVFGKPTSKYPCRKLNESWYLLKIYKICYSRLII